MFGLSPYVLLAGAAAVALSAGGGYFKGRADGKSVVNAQVAVEHAVAVELADRVAAAQQGKADASATAAADRQAYLDVLATRGRDTVKEYYRANPADDRPCLTADRVRSIAADDDAATTAPGPAGNRPAPLPDAAAPGPRHDLE